MLSLHTTVELSPNQVSTDLDGEVIVLGLKSGAYFGLDNVGVLIWNLIHAPRRVEAIREAILEEYDVDPVCCETDLLAFLEKLADEGLILIGSETCAV
jgi:hypothetical protein